MNYAGIENDVSLQLTAVMIQCVVYELGTKTYKGRRFADVTYKCTFLKTRGLVSGVLMRSSLIRTFSLWKIQKYYFIRVFHLYSSLVFGIIPTFDVLSLICIKNQ